MFCYISVSDAFSTLWCYSFHCSSILLALFISGSFAGFLYLFDAFNGKAKTVKLRRQKANCAVCGKNATITELGDCKELYGCSIKIHVKVSVKKTVSEEFLSHTIYI